MGTDDNEQQPKMGLTGPERDRRNLAKVSESDEPLSQPAQPLGAMALTGQEGKAPLIFLPGETGKP